MKKICKILISILLCLSVLFALCGCSFTKKEDVIPTKLGKPEGLYLYKGNTRSRTDGSEEERVLSTAEINGQTFSDIEYSLNASAYMTTVHKCYFVLTIDEERYIYLFDYKEKTGVVVGNLPADEKVYATSSDKYFYVSTESVHLLYDTSGTLLCDRIDGVLDGDLLYAFGEHEREYEWFYNGEYHCATKDAWFFDKRYYYRFGGYVYFFKRSSTIAIDLNTGEYYLPELLNPEKFPYNYFYNLHDEQKDHMYYADGTLYLLAVYYNDIDDDNCEWHTYLYGITGKEVKILHYFGNPRWGCRIEGTAGGSIYFQAGYNGKYSYYAYNIASGKMSSVRKLPDFSKSSLPTNYIKVGEYEFFTEDVPYTVFGSWGPHAAHCTYFCRRKGGKKEVMQYSFESNVFYDDICEF